MSGPSDRRVSMVQFWRRGGSERHTCGPVVTVAQSVELWIVDPAVVGSSPIGHPIFARRMTESLLYRLFFFRSQVLPARRTANQHTYEETPNGRLARVADPGG